MIMQKLWSVVSLSLIGAVPTRAEMICADAPYLAPDKASESVPAAVYTKIADVLVRFPSLAAVVEASEPAFCLSDAMNNAHGYFEPDTNRIVISRDLSRPMQAGVLLHELRHLWQSWHRACPTSALKMKEYARATYAIEADASAISLMIAWEMKEHGSPDVWVALSSWPQQADIARSFADAMKETGDAGLATTAAFYQWYASEARRQDYYESACSDYLDRQDEGHLIPRYQMIQDDFYEALCRLPDGRAYTCGDPRQD
nr:DUF6782 family putative metallopeptidase [Roseovarius sp. THAF9]